MSLSDRLAELTLDISDKTKTIDLLNNLIEEQKGRHALEVANFQKEIDASLKKAAADSDEALRGLFKANDALLEKKKALESRVEELTAEKQNAENKKKAALEAIRRDLTDAKEREHQFHKQQKADREKAWFDKRVSSIEQMTLKGIQPTIDRLMRKHKEDCDEIKCQTEVSKQKLELQCEEELMSRIQEFQRSEQQSRSCITQRNDFAHLLAQEQSEHVARMKKLKEELAGEEANSKKMFDMELETLTNENEVAISKINSSKSIHHLEQNLMSKREQRKYELDSEIDQIDRDLSESKKEWEESWLKTSKERKEQRNAQKMKELLVWRESRVNDLIRKGIIDQAELDSQAKTLDESQIKAEHKLEVESLRQRLITTLSKNDELKRKLASHSKQQEQLQASLTQLELDFEEASSKLDDAIARKERKQKQHDDILDEACRQVERSLDSLSHRCEEVELEIGRNKALAEEELSHHNNKIATLQRQHELELDELQQEAVESASNLDRKLLNMNNLIKEKEVYLAKANDLFSTRYGQHLQQTQPHHQDNK